MFQKDIIDQFRRVQSLRPEKTAIKVYGKGDVKLFIANLNRNQLRYEFVNADGIALSSIGGNYSPVTIQIASAKGRPKSSPANVDLYDTGAFSRSIKVSSVAADGITIDANTIKDGTDLEQEWGRKILGLTAESLEDLMQKVLPIWQELTLKYVINGSF